MVSFLMKGGHLRLAKLIEELSMPTAEAIQYLTDEEGRTTAVLVPIELWQQIASERETAHLLRSDTMRRRLLEAMSRTDGIPWEEARERLGI